VISAIETAEKYGYLSPVELASKLGLKIIRKDNPVLPGVRVYAELSGKEIIIYPASSGMNEDLLILHEIYHHLAGENWLLSEDDADDWAEEYMRVISCNQPD
jgi:hypothetical protein